MNIDQAIHLLARAVEITGVFVMLGGVLVASWVFFGDWSGRGLGEAYHSLRANLGRAILLGLEFLVVGDIIGTVAVEPTFQNLGVLGVIVLIRTFLSLALEVEISGQLPWRRQPGASLHQPNTER
ncbi:MAG: DUF1622 domain-containing protein [Gemmatimonadota bacterium]